MNKNITKKISISVVAVLLVVALAITMASFMGFEQSQQYAKAEAGMMYGQYVGTEGQITDDLPDSEGVQDGHYTKAEIASKLGIQESELLEIDNGATLYQFLNNQLTNQYAYLSANVGIAYGGQSGEGYYTTTNPTSVSRFNKHLEGNGYTVNLKIGGATLQDSNFLTSNEDTTGDSVDAWHQYAGFLCAINEGTIKNLTINYTSNLSTTTTANILGGTTLKVASGNGAINICGIVTGLNKGTIDNIRLNINSPFSFVKDEGSHRRLFQNLAIAGGIAGALTAGAISNSQVNIAGTASIVAAAQGSDAGMPTDHKSSAGIAGGMVGKIQAGDAKIEYCSLTGSGNIAAYGNKENGGYRYSLAGGAVGTSINVNGDVTFDSTNVNLGQIKGIISSWTGSRSDNWQSASTGTVKTINGLLFDAVGPNIQSCAVLYDLKKFTQQSGTASNTLDSGGKITNWTEVFPTTTDGQLYVRFDKSNTMYDLRIEAVADGQSSEFLDEIHSVDMSASKVPYYKYYMPEGTAGNIIWSGDFIKNGQSSDHIDMSVDKPIYAEIYMIKADDYGVFNYSFGVASNIEYVNTNDSSYAKSYTGITGKLNNPDVNFINPKNVQGNKSNITWQITRNGNAVKLEDTYMIGTYEFNAAIKMQTNTYAYYNDEERLVAWQPSQSYKFTINQGVLNFGSGTTNSDAWRSDYTFVLEMPSAGDFDMVKFQRNGVFVEGNDLVPQEGANSVTYVATDSTGKNGTNYTFYAYKFDALVNDYVIVAVSDFKTAKIDNQAPEIYDVQYSLVNGDGTTTPISQGQLSEWRTQPVRVSFMLTDNNKSGINKFADVNYQEVSDDLYSVTYDITDNSKKTLTFTDSVGNSKSLEVQANVDTISGTLNFGTQMGYSPDGIYGYDIDGLSITYSAYIGNSGWTMQYSYEQDGEGNDIWLDGGDLTNGSTNTLVVDWDMGTADQTQSLKMKMVNKQGLYDDVLITGNNSGLPIENGIVGNYYIVMRVANIYLDTSLSSIVEAQSGLTLKDILARGQAGEYFNKEYDGTTGYTKYTFDGYVQRDTSKVVYTPAYESSAPELGFDKIPMTFEYTTSDIGKTTLKMSSNLGKEYSNKFAVWFVNFAEVNFDELYGEVPENAKSVYELSAEITKIQMKINIADYIASTYYYGDEIPAYIDVEAVTGETIRVNLISDAKKGSIVGTYQVEGSMESSSANIEINATPATIEIVQRPIDVIPKFDGQEIFSSISFDAKDHYFTAKYIDVITNKEVDAVVVYKYTDKSGIITTVDKIKEIGSYIIELSIKDTNYIINSSNSTINFSVQKGILPIATGVVEVDYSGDNADYTMGISEELKNYYTSEQLQITYYKYYDGATYDPDKQQVIGNYNPEAPTTDTKGIGIYKVEVVFTGNDYFHGETYEDGILIVNKAKTKILASEKLTHSFDGMYYTYTFKEAQAQVRTVVKDTLLWNYAQENNGEIVIKYFNTVTSQYEEVSASSEEGFGWFNGVGTYKFRIEYLGNEFYEPCSFETLLEITKAEFKNVKFENTKFTYDGKAHTVKESIPVEYNNENVTKTYIYGGKAYPSLQAIMDAGIGINVGTYTITLRLAQDEYLTYESRATITIDPADLQIEVVSFTGTYIDKENDETDQRQYVTLEGLEKVGENYYYNGTLATIIGKNGKLEGNLFAIQAGEYYGEITIMVNNYNNLTLNTYILIYQAAIPASEATIDVPEILPTGVSIADYKGFYTNEAGEKVQGQLVFYNQDNKIVEPDELGILPDGVYTIRISVDRNHYIDASWTLTVGRINDANLGLGAWIAIGGVAAFVIAAIVVSVIVVSARKRAKHNNHNAAI